MSHSLAAKKRAARMMLGAVTMGLELTQSIGEAPEARGAGLFGKMVAPSEVKGVHDVDRHKVWSTGRVVRKDQSG